MASEDGKGSERGLSADEGRRLLFEKMRREARRSFQGNGASSPEAGPAKRRPRSIRVRPTSVGVLEPGSVSLEQQDSSLVAALAIAISAVRGKESAQETFKKIAPEARIHLTGGSKHADQIRNAERTVRVISSLKIPLFREVEVEPLIKDPDPALDETPLPRIFHVLKAGGAIVLPVDLRADGVSSRKRKGTLWGAVTGYAHQNSQQLEPHNSAPEEGFLDEPEPGIDFTVSIASRAARLRATFSNLELIEAVNADPKPIHTVMRSRL